MIVKFRVSWAKIDEIFFTLTAAHLGYTLYEPKIFVFYLLFLYSLQIKFYKLYLINKL